MNCSSITLNGTKCKKKAVESGKCAMHIPKTCSICLEDVSRGEKKLRCKHVFHAHCIIKWFETSIECPTCRMEQDDDPIIIFRKNIEDNLREKYKDAIKSLELELARSRRRT